MEHYAGIDVSLELSSVCVVDAKGKIVKEAKISSDPVALLTFFRGLGIAIERIGLEAGPLSQWLHAGLTQAGFEVVLLETRHVKAALSAMTVKTDRKDARGIAQLIRMGWFLAEDGHSDAQELRGAGPRIMRRPFDAGTDFRCDVGGAICVANRVHQAAQDNVDDRAKGRSLLPPDDYAGGRSVGSHHVQDGGRRSIADWEVQGSRGIVRTDAEKISVGGDRFDGWHHPRRRRNGAHGALRGSQYPAVACHALLHAQTLGNGCREAAWGKKSKGRLGAQDWRNPASDVGR